MSIHVPAADWFKAPTGGERTWIGLALAWCVVLSVAMPYWHLRGKQNSTGEAYAVEPMKFSERVEAFVASNKVGEENGVPVVQPAPGGDAYLLAQMWRWYPILKLKQGQSYRVHLSSLDLQHGFSLQPMNMNFQVLPGYDHVLTLTPTSSGSFTIICNEFCGIGHHLMTGRVIVEP
ncbi:MAG: cytochrome C oxidase subunit II [Deltaproteobacteria bacterium]|nr:cytochrome C oxidase subunit II [Deltaproteobacteria bacterium]